jgi:acetyltransferase-like isoleucine patch superfamily enzyme
MGFKAVVLLGGKAIGILVEGLIRNIPGPIGFKIRSFYYRFRFGHLGKNVLIDIGVIFNGPANIFIGDYVWIDSYCKFEAMLGEIRVGRRVHIAPFVVIGAREPVIIEDYAAVASGAKIYANSELPADGKRMSGPMIPEEQKAFYSETVFIGRDAVVGANAVVLPGGSLAEGAVLGANSVLKKPVDPWVIVVGGPARPVGMREPVRVPEP